MLSCSSEERSTDAELVKNDVDYFTHTIEKTGNCFTNCFEREAGYVLLGGCAEGPRELSPPYKLFLSIPAKTHTLHTTDHL
eukprot:scaffold1519_cov250-Pinguiococcus_pyrenoidosus.AAC.5